MEAAWGVLGRLRTARRVSLTIRRSSPQRALKRSQTCSWTEKRKRPAQCRHGSQSLSLSLRLRLAVVSLALGKLSDHFPTLGAGLYERAYSPVYQTATHQLRRQVAHLKLPSL